MSDFRVIIFRLFKFIVGWAVVGFYLSHVF